MSGGKRIWGIYSTASSPQGCGLAVAVLLYQRSQLLSGRSFLQLQLLFRFLSCLFPLALSSLLVVVVSGLLILHVFIISLVAFTSAHTFVGDPALNSDHSPLLSVLSVSFWDSDLYILQRHLCCISTHNVPHLGK